MAEKRIKTGIKGFDKLCKGGFVDKSINLVMGNAGSGKSTFLLQFLYNGATEYGQNGLYVSFEQEINDVYRTGKSMGMNFEKLDKQGRFKFIKMHGRHLVKDLQKRLMKVIIDNNIKRVCLDPINVLSVNLPNEINARKQIFELLVLLKKLGVCVLIAGEADEQNEDFSALSEEITFSKYLVDGIVELFSSGLSGEGDRALRISKMRMTDHFRGPIGMEINDKGIKVLKE